MARETRFDYADGVTFLPDEDHQHRGADPWRGWDRAVCLGPATEDAAGSWAAT